MQAQAMADRGERPSLHWRGSGIGAKQSVYSISPIRRGLSVNDLLLLLQPYRPLFEILNAAGSLLAVITWLIAIPLILHNWMRDKRARLEFSLMGIGAAALFGAATELWAIKTPAEEVFERAVGREQRMTAKSFWHWL
jgi:hypothetical protein